MYLLAEWEDEKSKKILFDKYAFMQAIRDGHVDNHFSDKFVSLCHIGYLLMVTDES